MKSNFPFKAIHLTNSGQGLLIGIVLVLLLLSIFVPFMNRLVSQEAKQNVSNSRSSRAFNLAEAGLERGIWKLKEDPAHWDNVLAGLTIANFSGDISSTYSEIGGEYKVTILPGPKTGQITIRSTGRDSSTQEVRTIEGVYVKGIHEALTFQGDFRTLPDFKVHWGPIVSYGTINVTTNTTAFTSPPASIAANSNTYYPRKISKRGIINRDNNPALPNTDSLEYWAFNTDMGDPPTVDLAYYKTRADNNNVPLVSPPATGGNLMTLGGGGGPAVAHTPGMGYFTKADNPSGAVMFNGYELISTSTVFYFENLHVAFAGFLDVEAIIMTGPSADLSLFPMAGVFQATIPVNAQDEYRHPNAQSIWTMVGPPPLGLGFGQSFASVGAGNCCFQIPGLSIHAFVYVGGTIREAGCNAPGMVGVVMVMGPDNSTMAYRDFTLYYDDSIAKKIKLVNDIPRRVSWREKPSSW